MPRSPARHDDSVAGQADRVVCLCCFPHAGGGASTLANWMPSFPLGIRLHFVEYPGREARFLDAIPLVLVDLVDDLADRLAPFLRPPFAFFGHSFGALVAVELTKLLMRRGMDLPLRLFVSGARAPQLAPRPAIGHLSDAEFIASLCQFNGMPQEVLADAGLMAVVLPIIRGDFRLIETHMFDNAQPLPVPVSVFGGRADRTTSPPDILAWSALTSKAFRSRFLEGDHFFPASQGAQMAAYVAEDLAATADSMPRG